MPGKESVLDRSSCTFQLGEKDVFSSLADDCLFSVLSYLDRNSLDRMERVSQKIYSLVNHDRYRKQKKMVHDFEIKQFSGEHAFFANPLCTKRKRLLYEKGGIKSYSRFFMYLRDGPRTLKHEAEPKAVSTEFFDAMQEMFRKYAPNMLKFVEIRLDNAFFENIVSAFDGDMPKTWILRRVAVENFRKLTEFILKWKIHDLKITNANEPMQNAFDEKFVVEFSLTSDEKHNFQVSTFPFGQVSRWTPTIDILPTICRYEKFCLRAMCMTIGQLKNLIAMAFDRTSGSIEWDFSLDMIPHDEDLSRLHAVSIKRPFPYCVLFKIQLEDRLCAFEIREWHCGVIAVDMKLKNACDDVEEHNDSSDSDHSTFELEESNDSDDY